MMFCSFDIEMDKDRFITQIGVAIFNTDNIIPDKISPAYCANIFVKRPDNLPVDFDFLVNFFPDYLWHQHEKHAVSPTAAALLLMDFLSNNQFGKKLFQWGEGDFREIKKQLFTPGCLPYQAFNIKHFYQLLYAPALRLEKKFGLYTACEQAGIGFVGAPHDAIYDAFNTGRLFCKIYQDLTKLREIKNIINK